MEQLSQAIQLRARQPSSEGELTPLAHTLTQVGRFFQIQLD